MARRERDILERAVHTIAEQAAKADDLVDEAKAAGGGDHPVTVHAKMLRLELLKVKVTSSASSRISPSTAPGAASTFIGSAVSASRPDIGRTESPRRTASRVISPILRQRVVSLTHAEHTRKVHVVWTVGASKPVMARERTVVSAFSNGAPTPEGQGAVSGALDLPAGSTDTVADQSTSWTEVTILADWQEPDLFTMEIRAAFRSLR
jgi:hypothetical protein